VELITGQQQARRDADEALMRRIQNGDETALGTLYDRYGGLVYSVANRILRDSGAAEEVLQDIVHQIWRTAARFDFERGSFTAWLLVMARSRSIDRLRRRSLPTAEDPAEPGNIALRADINLEDATARNLMMAQVRKALDALPETQRQAMELAYFEGLTQTEIASRTGDPLGTVKTRLRTAVASLKKALGA
jgi:RNA polymerase sigma-70 factor (ECF subfamily)